MDILLKSIRNSINKEANKITFILGNESCDLDSAVSSLVYGTFLNWQHSILAGKQELFVPILNVQREDYELKTEVNYCLEMNNINCSSLIFRDDYNYEQLLKSSQNVSMILVDHHILGKNDTGFKEYVTEIVDHRPKDERNWCYKDNVTCTIQTVGSCCTLIFKRIQQQIEDIKDFFNSYPDCARLLHGTIVLDTVNFSKEVNKATPLDYEVVNILENILKIDNIEERNTIFSGLLKALNDVSNLTAEQLLKKDVKVMKNILVPSFRLLVWDFLQRPNVLQSMSDALVRTGTTILVLVGMTLEPELGRDVAIVSMEGSEDVKKLSNLLEECSRPSLRLVKKEVDLEHCVYYEQNNLSASRKQIVPVINEFLNENK